MAYSVCGALYTSYAEYTVQKDTEYCDLKCTGQCAQNAELVVCCVLCAGCAMHSVICMLSVFCSVLGTRCAMTSVCCVLKSAVPGAC